MTATGTFSPVPTGTASPTPTPTPTETTLPGAGKTEFVYPNPVAGKTGHLVYQLEAAGKIQVRVYNAAYDLAAKFEDAQDAGRHEMTLNLQSFAPGVYYLLLDYKTDPGRRTAPPIKIYVPGGL